MDDIVCPQCGSKQPANMLECNNCRHRFPESMRPAQEPAPASRGSPWVFLLGLAVTAGLGWWLFVPPTQSLPAPAGAFGLPQFDCSLLTIPGWNLALADRSPMIGDMNDALRMSLAREAGRPQPSLQLAVIPYQLPPMDETGRADLRQRAASDLALFLATHAIDADRFVTVDNLPALRISAGGKRLHVVTETYYRTGAFGQKTAHLKEVNYGYFDMRALLAYVPGNEKGYMILGLAQAPDAAEMETAFERALSSLRVLKRPLRYAGRPKAMMDLLLKVGAGLLALFFLSRLMRRTVERGF